MSGSSQPLEPSLKRGRTFLCGALVILGVLLVHGLRKGPDRGDFYVLAVYFGSVNIRRTRYALACGLFADLVSVVVAILVAYAFFH
ncbi:MAG TPA: hypothetical protein PLS03_02670, partial [Terrimicrobiaceae bacterium]|nr:hypothetical protein [Terrimicrobiaceae bacterium]